MSVAHRMKVRVYYEDTDLAGIVYYANYLKFIERGRTEYVREIGLDQTRLKVEQGIVFAVRRVEADYVAPAKFDDVLDVVTTVERASGVRLVMRQAVERDGAVLFEALVTLVAMSETGAPVRLPAELRQAFAG